MGKLAALEKDAYQKRNCTLLKNGLQKLFHNSLRKVGTNSDRLEFYFAHFGVELVHLKESTQ